MHDLARLTTAWLLAALCAGPIAAAEAVTAAARPGTAPRIDGHLDDAFWRSVPAVTTFRQAAPKASGEPTRRTELRIAHDGVQLYVAVRAFDPAPAGIVARTLRRDAEAIEADDHVAIVLDPQGSGRNGFVFRVNALGARRDGLVSDGSTTRTDWDTLWDAAAQIDDAGWSVELAIPLATLAAPADGRAWGLNAERHVGASGERMRLFAPTPEREVDSLTDAGPLTGIAPLHVGWGLRLQPAVRWSGARTDGQSTRGRLEPSLDALYQLTPTMSATLTLNSDFADADIDDRIVSLSRFELFRPEKRSFFTQDAGRLTFGGLDGDEPVLVPFFSRRIGLGRSLDAGVKLSGTAGPVDLGAFAVQVPGGVHDGMSTLTSRVGVLRAAAGLGAAQRLGFIATQGTPDGRGDNRVIGIDHQYRRTDLPGGRTIDANVWLLTSRDALLGAGSARGLSIDLPGTGPTGGLSAAHIDEAFQPALGYVRETGVRRADGHIGWWHHASDGTDLSVTLFGSTRTRLDRTEQSRTAGLGAEWKSARGDYIEPEIVFERDVLAHPFDPLPGVRIPAGEHRFRYAVLSAGLAASREWSGEASLRGGGYYDGRLSELNAKLTWRPSAHWSFAAGLSNQRLRHISGSFTARAASLRIEHAGSTRSAQTLLVQHDNVSGQSSVGLRTTWVVARGQEMKVAVDHATQGRDGERAQTRATVRLGWTFER